MIVYGTKTTGYGYVERNTYITEIHQITLTGLSPSTTYHYTINSTTRCGTSTTSTDHSFRTADMAYELRTNFTANIPVTISVEGINTTIKITTNVNISNSSISVISHSSSQVNKNLRGIEKYRGLSYEGLRDKEIDSIIIAVGYSQEDVDTHGINESSPGLYWFNESSDDWLKINNTWNWVNDNGIDTEDNYVWANLTHFSYYAWAARLL